MDGMCRFDRVDAETRLCKHHLQHCGMICYLSLGQGSDLRTLWVSCCQTYYSKPENDQNMPAHTCPDARETWRTYLRRESAFCSLPTWTEQLQINPGSQVLLAAYDGIPEKPVVPLNSAGLFMSLSHASRLCAWRDKCFSYLTYRHPSRYSKC